MSWKARGGDLVFFSSMKMIIYFLETRERKDHSRGSFKCPFDDVFMPRRWRGSELRYAKQNPFPSELARRREDFTRTKMALSPIHSERT